MFSGDDVCAFLKVTCSDWNDEITQWSDHEDVIAELGVESPVSEILFCQENILICISFHPSDLNGYPRLNLKVGNIQGISHQF